MQANLSDLIGNLGQHLTAQPQAALLLLLGALLVAVPSAILGYLSLGALVDLIIPDATGQHQQRADR